MVVPHTDSDRNISSFSILVMVAAGLALGVFSFLLKIALDGLILDASFLPILLTRPLVYIAAIIGLVGFFLFQKALHRGKISIVTPTITGLSMVIPVLLAFVFLADFLSILKIAGIILILFGIFGLRD